MCHQPNVVVKQKSSRRTWYKLPHDDPRAKKIATWPYGGDGAKDKDDSGSLLRLCSEWDFAPAVKICSSLLENLSKGISSAEQADLADQLLATDAWGNTSFHVACFHKPPLRLVEMFLALSRRLSLNLHLLTNHQGATPLNTACVSGASLKVIQALLDAIKNPHGLTSTSSICQCDDRGISPISAIYRRYTLYQRVLAMRQNNKDRTQEYQGRKFADSKRKDEVGPSMFAAAAPDGHRPLSQDAIKQSLLSGMGGVQFWETLDRLLEAALNDEVHKSRGVGGPLLDDDSLFNFPRELAAAYFCHLLPQGLADLILKDSFTEANGEMIMHLLRLAVSRPWVQTMSVSPASCLQRDSTDFRYTSPKCSIRVNAILLRQKTYFIQQLLAHLPPSTSHAGRLLAVGSSALILEPRTSVFIQAVASGLCWKVVDDKSESPGPLQVLFEASPSETLLDCQDPVTGLFPFQLAAAAGSTLSVPPISMFCLNEAKRIERHDYVRAGDEHEDLHLLDTIYTLLRQSPQQAILQ